MFNLLNPYDNYSIIHTPAKDLGVRMNFLFVQFLFIELVGDEFIQTIVIEINRLAEENNDCSFIDV